MSRFLCAGDLHLGAGADLGNAPGERLADQEAVLESIVRIANDLDAVLLWAGDAWERRRPTPAELLAFKRPLEALRYEPIGIAGNHDVEAFQRPTGYDLSSPDFETEPQILIDREATQAAIACLPWAPPGRLVALEGGGDRDELNRRLADGLVDIARGLFAQMPDDRPRILLAHWAVGGAETPSGVPAELFREPVLDALALDAIGFDAIVLGHVHKAQMIEAGDGRRPMFYVGSPMPLNFGEARVAHGCYLLDVEHGEAYFVDLRLESRPLVTVELDAHRSDDERLALGAPVEAGEPRTPPFEALARHLRWRDEPDAVSPVDGAIVKVIARGTAEQARRWDLGELRRNLTGNELGAHKVWAIQTEIDRPDVVRVAGVDETIDDVEALRLFLGADTQGVRGDLVDPIIGLHRRYLEEAQK